MNIIKKKSQNPKQLLRLFIFFSFIAFLLIAGTTGYGINSISKDANIAEAEHDSVIISNTFLEHEGKELIELVSPSKEPTLSHQSENVTDSVFYSIQAGTFSLKSGALQRFHEIENALLKSKDILLIRAEKIGKFNTVRIGMYPTKAEAENASKNLSFLGDKPIIVKSTIKPDRIIKTNMPLVSEPQIESEEIDYTKKPNYLKIDDHIRTILSTTDIIKIKIFTTDGIIAYSTDTSIINKNDSNNPRLQDALSGNMNSLFKRKDEIVDVVGEKKIDLDVVETYLPMKNENGEIIGAYEVYMDITRYRLDVKERLLKSVTLVSIVLIAVLGVFIILMRAGTKELSKVQEKLTELSSTDGLTGLFNRRFVFDRLEKEFERLHSDEHRKEDIESVGCIMADIDHFKSFNDKYGHQIGDKVLQFVSKRILDSLRPYDIAGRYGGEEFLIILPNSTLDDTQKAAERIWKNIRKEGFETIEGTFSITISVGLACLTNFDSSVEDAIKRADASLYKAKENGRDQVHWDKTLEVKSPLNEQKAS